MAQIIGRGAQQWKNYHGSVNHRVAQQCDVRFDTLQGQPVPTLVQIANATAQMLGRSRLAGQTVNPMGSAWSFTDLVAGDGCILGMRVNDGGPCSDEGLVWSVTPEQARIPNPECLALVWGGTRIGQLNRALAARGRSIRTSGSHDGQTVAGAVGTGVHGGAHRAGGFQNHIRALHIVAGPGRSWWLERRSQPVMADGFARQLGARLLRDDRMFDAALIHLGGMGVINAVVMETVPLFICDVLAALAPISPAWLDQLAAGNWRALTQGHDADPYFIEVTLDPFNPFTQPAMHTLYFQREQCEAAGTCALDDLHLNQPLNGLGRAASPADAKAAAAPVNPQDIDVPALLRAQFQPTPFGQRWGTWGELNGPHKPLAPLYNAAFAIPRGRIADAVQAALAAVRGLPPHFVFTLRPVDHAAGTMAFTRFPETVVINLDGLGASLSPVGPMAAKAVRAALDAALIPYGMHWGKLGGIDADLVARDYPVGRVLWQAARRRLLPPAMRAIITNPALGEWGLV